MGKGGYYRKRRISETMISVVKSSDSVRGEENKRKMVMLMGIAYNIHVIVRWKGIEKFYFSSLNLFFIIFFIRR